MKALRKIIEHLLQLYHLPGEVYGNFKTFCVAALSAIRDLSEAIKSHQRAISA